MAIHQNRCFKSMIIREIEMNITLDGDPSGIVHGLDGAVLLFHNNRINEVLVVESHNVRPLDYSYTWIPYNSPRYPMPSDVYDMGERFMSVKLNFKPESQRLLVP